MNRAIYLSTILFLTISFISCNRIKNKSKKVAKEIKENTVNVLKEQTQKVVDKVYPTFDSDKPDTDNNKKSFKDFIKVELTKDVKNIYYFDDAVGIDADYMFSFNCNETTSKKVITRHNFSVDTISSDNGFAMQHDFDWWDKDKIENLQKYSWQNEKQHNKYYWYDKENQKAYFFEFTL